MQVGDRVFVRHDDEDLWALVIAIESAGDPSRVRLKLVLELDGVSVGTCMRIPTKDTAYMRFVRSL